MIAMMFLESLNLLKRIDVIRERPIVKPSMHKITRAVRGAKIEIPSPTRKVTTTRANNPRIKLTEFEIEDAKAKT
jgi:hypothetical protein